MQEATEPVQETSFSVLFPPTPLKPNAESDDDIVLGKVAASASNPAYKNSILWLMFHNHY